MEKSILLLTAALLTFSSCEKEEVLPSNDIPTKVESYVSTHFPDQTITQVVKDRDGLELTYDVLLDNMISLEFNKKKEIIDIDGDIRLPDAVVPSVILTFVTTNYPDNYIISWELDEKNQQVELESGLELKFSKRGAFLRIDD